MRNANLSASLWRRVRAHLKGKAPFNYVGGITHHSLITLLTKFAPLSKLPLQIYLGPKMCPARIQFRLRRNRRNYGVHTLPSAETRRDLVYCSGRAWLADLLLAGLVEHPSIIVALKPFISVKPD